MTKNKKIMLFCIICLILLSSFSLGYKQKPIVAPVHQYITKEAVSVWPLIPNEIKNHTGHSINDTIESSILSKVGYSSGKDIITGSGEEDVPIIEAFQHFWEPDSPWDGDYNDGLNIVGFYNQQSSYRKALEYWKYKVIPLYVKGEYDESYYWLGRVAHLLEDATVTEHMRNDCHLAWWYFLNYLPAVILNLPVPACENSHSEDLLYDDSSLEEYTATNYSFYSGSTYEGNQYNYESLPNMDSFDWSQVDAKDKQNIELFRLFWYVAQKTQYFASDDVDGNSVYYDLNDQQQSFPTSLWTGDSVTIIDKNEYLAKDDITNSGPNITAVSDAVIPHAMRAVAGLYRLFDDAVRIDWPTENHDFRRTGFTLLKGDMKTASQVEKTAFVLGTNITQEQVLKPIVADIDGNGAMETVNLVHNIKNPDRTDIYSVEIKDKKTVKKWKQTALGGAIYFPGTLANLDSAPEPRKELITGTRDGRIYAYNIGGSGGNSISTRWSSPGYYQLAPKWSSVAAENVVRFNGGNAVVDLDLDGKNEIILADVVEYDGNWNGEVYVLKDNGNNQQPSKWGWYQFGQGGAYATVSAANIDSDDNPEIIVPSMYGIYVFDYNSGVSGKLSLKWSNSDGRIQSSAIIADVDMDNEYERKLRGKML